MVLKQANGSGLPIIAGDRVTRSGLDGRFGGGIQGGILTPAGAKYIFLFSDPDAGSRYGYGFDGWEDGEHRTFFYTGAGSTGPQALTNRNKVLYESLSTGREVHLFLAVGTRAGSKEKVHEYLGQFALDGAAPYRIETGLGADMKELRTVLVFRLNRFNAEPLPASGGHPIVGPVATHSGARVVSREANQVLTYKRAGIEESFGTRRERILEDKLIAWLQEQGKVASRLEVVICGQSARLYTDTWVASDRELFEVKGDATRNDVRMAIAQLLDCSRHIAPAPTRATVVLPTHPGPDLADLVSSCGLKLAIMTDVGLERTN
jgi:hypothetical protein